MSAASTFPATGFASSQLPVGAQEMGRMALRHAAQLACRRPRAIEDQARGNPAVAAAEPRTQGLADRIVADDANEKAARAEACNVAGDVAGAADDDVLARDIDHRRRRLRRNAGYLAIDEIVQHQIADAEDRLVWDVLEPLFEIEHCLADFTGSDRRYRENSSRSGRRLPQAV
jgi:hypothetical protein